MVDQAMRIGFGPGRDGGRRPSRPLPPAAVLAGVLILAVAVAVGCSAPGPDASPSAEARGLVPAPSAGLLPADSISEGVDGGVPFVEFRSAEAPAGARATYEQTLREAGFRVLQRKDAWTAWGTDRVTIWVSVSRSGPPTSIVVRYAPGVADATMLATAGAEGSSTDPTQAATDPGATATSPGASPSPVITAVNPATPQPPTRPGGPFATPRGQGNRPTAKPPGKPTAKPTKEPATATPEPTKKPHPTPKPTKEPKPTKAPKPTPPGKGNKP
jgi:hypothetical protein